MKTPRKFLNAVLVVAAVAWTLPPAASAQDPSTTTQEPAQQEPEAQPQPAQPAQPQAAPKPAGRQYGTLSDDEAESSNAQQLTPDGAPLTGALIPGVGSPEMRHSYWVPGFQYGNFIRSSKELQPFVTDWNTTNFIAGNLSLLQSWSHSQFALNYSGGGSFSTDEFIGNSAYQQLSAVQNFVWRKAQLSIIDQFSYLPETQFGFGSNSSLVSAGVGGAFAPTFAGLQPTYQPNQTIFAALGSRYSNSITTQLEEKVSTRSAISLTASYGLLHFVEPGNIDSNDVILSGGYDYALTKNDSIGVLYRYSAYQYPGNPQAIHDHTAELAYGRKITGRLALQLFVGPELTDFRIHQDGFNDRTSITGGGNVTYSLPRTNIFVSYNHGVSGGSGAFTGSNSDTVQGTVNRQVTRVWRANVNSGYARNNTLASGNAALLSLTFNTYYVGAGVERPLGRNADLTLGYTAYVQDTSQSRCTTDTCRNYVQHQVSMSFQWHAQPFVLR